MSKKIICILLVVLLAVLVFLKVGKFSFNGNQFSQDKDTSYKRVKEKGEMVVGVNMPYGLMEFTDEKGEAAGFDIDVIKEVAKRIGVQAIIKNYDWDDLFVAVKNNEIDTVISSVTITKERGKEMLFSDPYANVGQVIIALKDNKEITGKESLINKKIGSQKDTTGLDITKEIAGDSAVTAYESYSDTEENSIIQDLKSKKIDAIIVDYGAALGIIKENPEFKIVGQPITEEFSGIVANLGSKELIGKINEALRDIKRDGTLKSIEAKWLQEN